MIDILKSEIQAGKTLQEKNHILREYMQILLLKSLYDLNAYKTIAFTGGTALRILYNTQRYSEDLDFSKTNDEGYNFNQLINKIEKWMDNYGLYLRVKTKQSVIDKAEFRFSGLLFELELSSHETEKLMIKLEVDTNPPKGAFYENKILNDPYMFMIRSLDLQSLFSGKLNAVITRKYIKSRDYYDLLWFLSKSITPNFELLKNGAAQMELDINPEKWKEIVLEKLESLDFNYLQNDIRFFLKEPRDAQLLTLDNFKSLL